MNWRWIQNNNRIGKFNKRSTDDEYKTTIESVRLARDELTMNTKQQ
jgi:hypothetical protein